ncbi:IclR family transcriptional regulator domain-containing protein [Streptomyces phaeochromogenes]|uniref:IclR family transcriptional regulator domain-containing protein n=1 Tax=Streptomyces phaeochromogenes TaxID=1923 RepID=UPI00099E48A2
MTTERPQPDPNPQSQPQVQPQHDDIGGILIHRGLREELSRLADAAESGRRAEAVQEQIELVIAVLHQHHHGEDEKLHPLVRDREPSIATILDELEKEHTLIQKLADDAADRTRPLPERAPVIRELLDVLRPHLALEEAEVFPAITRQVSQAEFEEFVKGELKAAGRRLPAHCTSVGKMLLASLSEPELTARIPDDADLIRMTPNSITEPAALREALNEIRVRGIAVESRESNPDVSCVAAPVRDRTGQVVAALSISVPMIRWSDERRAELEQLAAKGAAELSERLGHRSVG